MSMSLLSRRSRFVFSGAAVALVVLSATAWQARGTGAEGQPGQRPANRLRGATSPYLLQHAHNPVDWYPWGPEALEKAKKEGKPIFLSIGYSACHWCHVMERESFEDDGIAAQLNEHFVSIKVDREERPDLDEIYMTAVQMMTGRGGWPMSTFLTPEGKPFFGGTYFPRDQFAELLRKVESVWKDPEKRKQLEETARRVSAAIGQTAARAPEAGQVSPALFQPAVRGYLEELDAQYGGFGAKPKFPPSTRLALMLAEHRKRPDPKLLRAVTLTLDRMASGGIYDHVGGGFHRYSVDEKWLVPHFEKMLYDNALLSWIYLEAFRETQDIRYRRIATETLDFVLRELTDPGGGFWSTLDADSAGAAGEKEEGRFYTWTPVEVIAVLGKADGELFNRIYSISAGGHVDGRSIPNLISKPVEAWAKSLKTSPAALQSRLNDMRRKLMAAREKRPRPALDDKVLANWNGLMLCSLALAYDLTGDERYRRSAEKAATFVLTSMRRDGRLLHAYRQKKTQPLAFLEDYSYMIVGLLELHRATGDDRWRKDAASLARTMVADFWDETSGTLFSTPHGHEQLLVRSSSAEDGATPSGQSMAALGLVQLSRLTEDGPEATRFRSTAQGILDAHATPMKRYPAAMPGMLLAAHTYFTPEARSPAPGTPAPVAISIAEAPPQVRPGQVFDVAVRISIQPDWHINANRPAAPELTATQIAPAPGSFKLISALYPAATTVRLGFASSPLKVYTGRTVVRLKLKALQAAAPAGAAHELRLRVRYQACNDRICLRPTEELLTVPLRVAASGQ